MKPYFWTLVLFLGVWDIYSVLPKRAPFPDPGTPPGLHYKQGIIHVHSFYSDGSGTVPEIAEAAEMAGMDFVVLTDHNTSRARKEGFEKTYGGVDMFVEMEASTPAGHCLTFFSQTSARNLSDEEVVQLSYQHFLGKDTRPGLFIVTAHPSNLKIPWTALDRSPDGTEIVNFDSTWRQLAETATLDITGTLLLYPFNNYLAAVRFLEVNPKDFLTWDTMNSVSRGHFGTLGQDTHAKLKLTNGWSIPWPGYLQTFKLGSNVIFYKEPLSPDFEERKKQLYRSLREGRAATTFQVVYPFKGNDWRVQCGDAIYRSGDDVQVAKTGCEFITELPRGFPYKATVRLIRNGDVMKEVPTSSGSVRIPVESEGVYRLEVWAHMHSILHLALERDVPYVFYNPIYVTGGKK